MDPRAISKIKERLEASKSPVALTGAGVSAESGVPTFRGPNGLWKTYKPEDLATPEAFERDPFLVWEWYNFRREKIASVSPNPAHEALARLEASKPSFTLITQNVDGLHCLAGSRNVLEIHGSIWNLRCVECGNSSENRDVPIGILPRCACGGLLRPGVVWFGESLPEDIMNAAFEAAEKADFMMVVGTSGVVQPAASLASVAKRAGAFTVEINTDSTPLSDIMDERVEGRAGEILPVLVTA
ncbi:MAG: NAD-dependent deacylase [Deltaproteobacteria bacterium]|nr:NAD-dependent deacylase [Deltaproteobacteria bacterium]